MEDSYDCVILGTGLKECILSGILSVEGKKVLHMDRNNYYGGETASLNLKQLCEKFGKPLKESLGSPRDYNVDLIPKFLTSAGTLVQILVKTDVTRYLDFKAVDGSFVVQGAKVYKVPSTAGEALASPLMGIFEKRRCGQFLEYVSNYEEKDPKTHKNHDLKKMTARALFNEFGLKADTIDFVGHGMALQFNDEYLDKPALTIVRSIKEYAESVLRYGNSPYIYPMYGLGDMPQAFARLSAIYGGTYMLNRKFDGLEYDANGRVCGVKSEGEVAKCSFVIGDPSYFMDRVQKTSKVVRCICICSSPIPGTNNAESAQVILSQKEFKRKNDIYIGMVSFAHNVAPKGKYICIISTIVETANPEQELQPAFKYVGTVEEKFVSVEDIFEPTSDGSKDGVFVSKSYDSETHFGQSCDDILDIYTRITKKPLDLTPPKKEDQKTEA